MAGLRTLFQKFSIFQTVLKQLKEQLIAFEKLQASSGKTKAMKGLKNTVLCMQQEAVILKNRIYCQEQYLQHFVKHVQVKLKTDSIQLDRIISNLSDLFPQIEFKNSLLFDRVIINDMDKLMYFLISIISNAHICAKILPITVELSSVSSFDVVHPAIRISRQNLSCQSPENYVPDEIKMKGENSQQLTGKIGGQNTNNLKIDSCKDTQIKGSVSDFQNIIQTRRESVYPLRENCCSPPQFGSTDFPNKKNSLPNGIINLGNQVNSSGTIQMPGGVSSAIIQSANLSQNRLVQQDPSNNWDGVKFKISFFHNQGQQLMEHFNCSEDKDSLRIELKLLHKYIHLVGPQNNIMCKSSVQLNETDQGQVRDNFYEEYGFYLKHFNNFYSQAQEVREEVPHHMNQKLILSDFELIVYKNVEIANNRYLPQPRQSTFSLQTHFPIPKLISDEMLPISKPHSSFLKMNIPSQIPVNSPLSPCTNEGRFIDDQELSQNLNFPQEMNNGETHRVPQSLINLKTSSGLHREWNSNSPRNKSKRNKNSSPSEKRSKRTHLESQMSGFQSPNNYQPENCLISANRQQND